MVPTLSVPAASPPAAAASTAVAGGGLTSAAVGVSPPKPDNLSGLRATLQALETGFATVIPKDSVLPSVGGGYAQATVVAELNGWLALYQGVESAKAATVTAQAALHTAVPTARSTAQLLKDALVGYFGRGNPMLVKFGIAARKPLAKKTAAQVVVSAAKAKRTRTLRGTTSKKAKAAQRFQGTLVAQAPVEAQSASATATGANTPSTAPAAPSGVSAKPTGA